MTIAARAYEAALRQADLVIATQRHETVANSTEPACGVGIGIGYGYGYAQAGGWSSSTGNDTFRHSGEH